MGPAIGCSEVYSKEYMHGKCDNDMRFERTKAALSGVMYLTSSRLSFRRLGTAPARVV